MQDLKSVAYYITIVQIFNYWSAELFVLIFRQMKLELLIQ